MKNKKTRNKEEKKVPDEAFQVTGSSNNIFISRRELETFLKATTKVDGDAGSLIIPGDLREDMNDCRKWATHVEEGNWIDPQRYNAKCEYPSSLLHLQTSLRRYVRLNKDKSFEVLSVFPSQPIGLVPIGWELVIETGATEAWIKLYDSKVFERLEKTFIFLHLSEIDQNHTEVLAYFPWVANGRPESWERVTKYFRYSEGGTRDQQEELWSSIEAYLTGRKTTEIKQAEQSKRGMKIGTAERVREMHRLLKSGLSQRQARKQSHCDPGTYQRWCLEATGEEPIEPYR